MRKKRVIINTLTSLFSYLFIFFLGVYVRKLFLQNFTIEFLGYEGLFTSIFSVLSIAELGAGGMFNYMLYDALAKDDMSEVAIVMGMYQKLYQMVGIVVLLIGGGLFFFLPILIQEEISNWIYVYIIYFIQLMTVLATYFLAYRRALVLADQKSSQVVQIETMYRSLCLLAQSITIIITHSYLVYLVIPLITNVLSSIHIAKFCKWKYPKAFGYKASLRDFQKRKAFQQLRELLIAKISTIIFTSTDNILITILTGIRNVAMFSNYDQINKGIIRINSFFIEAVERSTGNMVYTASEEKKLGFFIALDFFSFEWGLILTSGFLCVFQRVIALLYGSEYLMPYAVSAALAADIYVRLRGVAYNAFRGAVGHYELSRWFSIISAISNLLLSFIWGQKWGVAGILCATVIGDFFIESGRAYVMAKVVLPQSIKRIAAKEFVYAGILMGICLIAYRITVGFSQTWIGFLFSGFVSVFVSIAVSLLLFCRSKRFRLLIIYIKETLSIHKT